VVVRRSLRWPVHVVFIPFSSRVNHVANDDEECSRPVEHAETENRLFL
jgi:hypothetical protein